MDKIYYFTFDSIRNKINTKEVLIKEEKKDCYVMDGGKIGILTVAKNELDKPIFGYGGFSMFSLKNNPQPLIRNLKAKCISVIWNKVNCIDETISDIKDCLRVLEELENQQCQK